MHLGTAWRFRRPISIDNTAGGGGSVHMRVTLDTGWSLFWDNVLATGADVRICGPDGRSLLTLKRETWDYANKSATFAVTGLPVEASSMCTAWLYWGNASAADAATTPTITTPLTGSIALQATEAARLVTVRPERPSATAPATTIVKTSAEAVRIWWDFAALLELAEAPINGSKVLEELIAVTAVQVLNAAEEHQASMVDLTKTRLHGAAVTTWAKAGTEATSYIARVTVKTSTERVLECRALLTIQDLEL